jgi:UDPglucose--hexose-1-phosphate uridylyltransferase
VTTRATRSSLLRDQPHRRWNALTGEWVFVSPHRTQRPWQGKVETAPNSRLPQYDPDCYLCPGNLRANREHNPRYDSTYIFDNDFPSFMTSQTARENLPPAHPLLQSELRAGTCRVLCYSPRHDLTLAQMAVEEIRNVLNVWGEQSAELGQRWEWVQIFENHGEQMGCSNPHPHGQIWAGDFIPTHAARELVQQNGWLQRHNAQLLLDYAALECSLAERVVVRNEHWVAVVPWWAVWPFETLLLPLRSVRHLCDLTAKEGDALADLLKRLLTAYDDLFDCSFPYSFGWHAAPSGRKHLGENDGWQLHAHFYPPLLRSATVRKFMVGYELLGEAQRDMTPEHAAELLRATTDSPRIFQ